VAIPKAERKYQIQHLWEKHYEMARLAVVGYSNIQIAEIIGMSPDHISIVMNSKIFKEHVQVLRAARDAGAADISRRIIEVAPIALARIKEVVEEPIFVNTKLDDGTEMRVKNPLADPSLAIKASQDLLDRAGFGAVEKKITANYDISELEKLKQAALQAGIANGQIISDAVFEDTPEEPPHAESN